MKYINARFREMFGYDLDDIPDGRTWFRRAFPDREYANELVSVLIPAGQPRGWEKKEHHPLTAVTNDGTRKIVDFGAVRLHSGDVVISCEDTAERMADENETLYAADHDALTGLPNRSSLERAVRNAVDRAKEGKRRRGMSALLLIDVGNFRGINEAHGDSAGDEVLVTLGKLVKSILRAGDNAYRFGGDRFVVVFKGISLAEAKLAAERVQRTIRQFTFFVKTQSLLLDIAVALVQIDGSEDAVTLIAHATKATDKAKSLGRNQMAVHKSDVEGELGE